MATELGVLLSISILGSAGFAVFEVETPWWRKVLKWAIVCGATLSVSLAIGHWSVLLPIGAGMAGIVFHVWWCRKNGIDPVRATPRKRYYELRGWAWPE